MANWYEMLKEIMEKDGEIFDEKICTLTNDELLIEFDAGFGATEGKPFTAWGKNWVYFPLEYDGAEGIGHAPRFPCDISMGHQ